MMQISRLFLGIFFILFSITSLSYAAEIAADNDTKGWHWFHDPKEENDDDESADTATNKSTDIKEEDPIAYLDAVHATVKRALSEAIRNPTKENVTEYRVLQNQVSQQAETFSNVWKAVSLEHPELDYSLKHPTNNMARKIESDQVIKKEEAAIQTFAKSNGLFFFYRSTCPYCQSFAPIIKAFAETYHIHVIPITTDGIDLPEFPHSYPDQGQVEKFHITVEPALFAVNPYTHQAYPIAYGLMSLDDLKKRILDLANHFGDITDAK